MEITIKSNTKILFLCVFLQMSLLMVSVAKAFIIEIDVLKILEGDITSFYYNSSTNLVRFNIEFRNRGSIEYKGRIRIDVFESSESNKTYDIFTAWGAEKVFMPGDKENSELYWYTNSTGNFTVRVRVYYAGEILEEFFEVEKKESLVPAYQRQTDVFKIIGFRTYDDFVIFDLVSKKTAEDVIIIPYIFRKGWIFEQEKIRFLNSGKRKIVILPYSPGIFTKRNLTIQIITKDSKFYSEKTFKLSKKRGIEGLVFSIIDDIKIVLSRLS